jgi:hypothetical protein
MSKLLAPLSRFSRVRRRQMVVARKSNRRTPPQRRPSARRFHGDRARSISAGAAISGAAIDTAVGFQRSPATPLSIQALTGGKPPTEL